MMLIVLNSKELSMPASYTYNMRDTENQIVSSVIYAGCDHRNFLGMLARRRLYMMYETARKTWNAMIENMKKPMRGVEAVITISVR
jgi:hypothetical protein